MPNHVTNKVTFIGSPEDIENLLQTIRGESENGKQCYIDFNRIIPTPINIFQGGLGSEERRLYGSNNWYDWNRENWGTKWNAYDSRCIDNILEFDTAWSAPHPVVEQLAKMFPDITICHIWADEDIGSNTGCIVYKGRAQSGGYYEDRSKAAYEAYIDTHGESDCLGIDKDGNYYHYNCDTCPNKCG